MFWSLLQIYEPISANEALKSWLSAPPGKVSECHTHLHYYGPIPYWAADWEELHVFFASLSSLTDKLVNCMCGIGSGLVVWMCTPEVYCGRFNKFMFPKLIESVKRIAVPSIQYQINKNNNDKLTSTLHPWDILYLSILFYHLLLVINII